MFSYVTMEQRIPARHPLRAIRAMVSRALERMDALFDELYSDQGRPSIAPERLLRARLLMILYQIRSQRQLMEQIDSNIMYRWFVGLELDDEVWDAKVFGWMKQDRLRQIKLRGLSRVDWLFQLAATAHDLLRMSKLIPIQAQA
jgi:transposase